MKVYRREDDRIMIFRPEENARRMQMGAERLLMQAPTTEQFIDAVKKTALANERWVLLFLPSVLSPCFLNFHLMIKFYIYIYIKIKIINNIIVLFKSLI